ncbi:MAG: hypothetical protein PVJ89_08140 [Planctomycetota bacterium]|jgi:hypothetical protein
MVDPSNPAQGAAGPRTAGPASPPAALLAAVAAASVAWCVLALAPPAGSLDDLFVVLVEARHWVDEQWVGGAARGADAVEGTTSPADVLCKAALLRLDPEGDPVRAAGWFTLGLLGVYAAAAAAALRSLGLGAVAIGVFTLGLLTAPGLLEAASFRLEGPLFALFWLGVVRAAMVRRPRAAAAWSAGLAWVRPEGILLGLAGCWLAAPREVAGRAWRIAAAAAVTVLPVTIWRLAVHGAWVPNTFHAKRSDRWSQEWMDGAAYLVDVLLTPAGVGLLAILMVALATSDGRPDPGAAVADGPGGDASAGPASRSVRTGVALAGVAAGVLVASGGDGYAGARLALPVGTPLWLGGAAALAASSTRVGGVALVAAGLQLVGGVTGPWAGDDGALSRMRSAAGGPAGLEVFEPEEEALRAAVAALDGEVFAHRHLQRLRWFCPDAVVLDLTGLTDREVARRPAPGPVRFGRDAVPLAVERGVGAMHLDPVGVRAAPLASADLVRALSDPKVAVHFGGEPYLAPELARRIASRWRGASRPVAGGFVNLLVREDLAERFRQQGFDVARP